MKMLEKNKIVEDASVDLRLRKTFTTPDLKSHSVLTDDVFTYVDFYFQKHVKRLKDDKGKPIKQNYIFYWDQAHNFYQATKILPIEASPLPMYYCMLNAAKAYILYRSENTNDCLKCLYSHGIQEERGSGDNSIEDNLSTIQVKRTKKGVFLKFSQMLDHEFLDKWKDDDKYSIKDLISSLPFVHSAYILTYEIKRKDEAFIPLVPGQAPTFYYCNDGKIHLVAQLQKSYFPTNAVSLPEDVRNNISERYFVSPTDPFCLISKEGMRKSEIKENYTKFRADFSFISAPNKLWYLNKKIEGCIPIRINSLSKIIAITHRFSEIVRYKPEQMVHLLNGKENWLIHEFLSLALDQFIDEIACEITKHEIMPPKYK